MSSNIGDFLWLWHMFHMKGSDIFLLEVRKAAHVNM